MSMLIVTPVMDKIFGPVHYLRRAVPAHLTSGASMVRGRESRKGGRVSTSRIGGARIGGNNLRVGGGKQ